MKGSLIILSVLTITFGKIIPKHQKEQDAITDIDVAQNLDNSYSNLLNMYPISPEMLSMPMNAYGYPNNMMSMQGPMNFMQNSFMNYPGMGMNFPSNSCPCAQNCPMCLPWFPCSPCSCPCLTNPPEIDTTTSIETTLSTTTLFTTPVPDPPQTSPSDCIPCGPCQPCGPIWWIPCQNCNCNNGCQTSPTIQTTNVSIPNNIPNKSPQKENRNNCQCICAPCPPWSECPPCPKNCPCY